MRKWEENQLQLVDDILIVDGEIVFQSSHRHVFLKLSFDQLFALVGQLLTVLHSHVLHNRLLEHAELAGSATDRIRCAGCRHLWIVWRVVWLMRVWSLLWLGKCVVRYWSSTGHIICIVRLCRSAEIDSGWNGRCHVRRCLSGTIRILRVLLWCWCWRWRWHCCWLPHRIQIANTLQLTRASACKEITHGMSGHNDTNNINNTLDQLSWAMCNFLRSPEGPP